jgi:RNA polymerase sigma-70 factor (ECF subfamily)
MAGPRTGQPCRPPRVIHRVTLHYCEGLALAPAQDDIRRELNRFLAGVESKAFRMARIALRHDDDALDAVQDAMLQLARRYAHRPAAEWRPLFYRILENRIRDQQRRRTVRGKVMALMPWRRDESEELPDPVAEAPDRGPGPAEQLEGMDVLAALERALAQLPARQREAFLLRNMEGLDVAQTAAAMGCSDGSVKTHYFRAVQALKAQLGEFWT